MPITLFPRLEKLMTFFRLFLFMVAISLGIAPGARAADDPPAPRLPRFASLSKDEIFVRTGPSLQYPIRWVYQKRGIPVEIVREYDTWRQIRDIDGSVGWVHHAMLSGYRNGIVQAKNGVTLTQAADAGSAEVVRLEKGVIVAFDRCDGGWCRVKISGFKGWAPRASFWGIYPSEEIR